MNPVELGMSWLALREKGRPVPGDFRVFDIPVRSGGPVLLLGIDSDNCRHLLIKSRQNGAQRAFGSAGVQVVSRTLEENGRSRTFVDVVCLRPDLNDLFDILVIEIGNGLAKDPADPALVCIRILERWQELLARDRQALLGIDCLTGLFGELYWLLRLLRLSPNAWECWFGPWKQRHDFATAGLAIEVKTSRARYGRLCEIHGHDQLEAPPGADLYLVYVRVETPVPNGISVPDLVEEVLEVTGDRPAVAERLRELGYDIRDNQAYRDQHFRVTEERMYAVDESFPRIIRESFRHSSVPAGVTGLVYQIDLSGEIPNPLSPEATEAVIQRMAGRKTDV
jgi:hypothetical protein